MNIKYLYTDCHNNNIILCSDQAEEEWIDNKGIVRLVKHKILQFRLNTKGLPYLWEEQLWLALEERSGCLIGINRGLKHISPELNGTRIESDRALTRKDSTDPCGEVDRWMANRGP